MRQTPWTSWGKPGTMADGSTTTVTQSPYSRTTRPMLSRHGQLSQTSEKCFEGDGVSALEYFSPPDYASPTSMRKRSFWMRQEIVIPTTEAENWLNAPLSHLRGNDCYMSSGFGYANFFKDHKPIYVYCSMNSVSGWENFLYLQSRATKDKRHKDFANYDIWSCPPSNIVGYSELVNN